MSEPSPLLSITGAPLGRRVAATLIDLLSMALMAFLVLEWLAWQGPGAPSTTVSLVFAGAVVALSPALLDTWAGASLGKRMLGLRVVVAKNREALGGPSLLVSVARHVIKFGSHLLLPGLWRIAELMFLRGRHAHEMLTGTRVFRVADLAGYLPPASEDYHQTLLRQMRTREAVTGRLEPQDPGPEVMEVYRLEDLDALDEAKVLAQKLTLIHPGSIECLTALARVLYREMDGPCLRQTLNRVREMQLDHPSVALMEAYLIEMEHQGDKTAARSCLKLAKQVLSDQADHYLANLMAGFLLRSTLEDPASAVPHLIQAVKSFPQRNRAIYNLFEALLDTDRFDEAMAFYSRSGAPGWPYNPLEYNFGTLMLNAGQHGHAITLFDIANRKKPGQNNIQHNRAICLSAVGRYPEAISQWSEVLKREPDWDWALMGRARAHHQSDNYHLGLVDTRHVLSLDPGDKEARHLQSMLLSCMKEDRAALELCDAMHKDGQIDTVELHSWYGFCRLACRDFSGAKGEYGAALAMDENHFLSNRGMAETLWEELRPLLETPQAIPKPPALAMLRFATKACELNLHCAASLELRAHAQVLVERAR